MSSTVQKIVNRAVGKIGLLAAGENAEAADAALALEALKGVYRYMITTGTLGELTSVIPTETVYTVNENERVIRNSDIVETIIFPDTVPAYVLINDYGLTGYTTDENAVRPPRDGAVVTVTDEATGVTLDHIYDGQTAKWYCIETLTLTDPAPLSRRDANGLSALLAREIAAEFGQSVTQEIQRAAASFLFSLANNRSNALRGYTGASEF